MKKIYLISILWLISVVTGTIASLTDFLILPILLAIFSTIAAFAVTSIWVVENWDNWK